jgi:hypothetical protein
MYSAKQQCIRVNIFIDEAPYIINLSVSGKQRESTRNRILSPLTLFLVTKKINSKTHLRQLGLPKTTKLEKFYYQQLHTNRYRSYLLFYRHLSH